MTRTSPLKLTAGAVLWISAALLFLVLEAITAAAVQPAYSYANRWISDLGVPAWSPRAALMNTAFWLQGILFLAGAVLIVRGAAIRRAWLFVFLFLVAANARGNCLVGTVHGGSAVVAGGYGSLHVVGAVLAIVGGNAAALVGSRAVAKMVDLRGYRGVSMVIAGVGFLSLVLLFVNTSTASMHALPSGALERVTVYTILAWQLFTGVVLLVRPAREGQWAES